VLEGDSIFLFSLPPPELLPKGSKEEQRDYVFYLAVGNYRLKVRLRSPF
jgi:hypothetical protein